MYSQFDTLEEQTRRDGDEEYLFDFSDRDIEWDEEDLYTPDAKE